MKIIRFIWILLEILFIAYLLFYLITDRGNKAKVIPYDYRKQSQYQIVLGNGDTISVANAIHLLEEYEYKLKTH